MTTEELLALATVLEIPRPDHRLPIQLRRSHGHTDRWAISDGMYGRRWHRELGWVYEPQGIRDEAERDATRYTLAEAVPLALALANPTTTAADDKTVAYRAPGSGALYCRNCCHGNGLYAPLAADDLPDGGLCTDCGVDVLIEPYQPHGAA